LAVLKVDTQDLTPVRWGNFSNIKVNQWAFACGNPFGLANNDGKPSITYGVVSAMGRDMTQKLADDPLIQYYGNLIETSSAINPGNSGGPLFNIDGQVIGVVTAIATSSGVSEGRGYAIPIDKDIRRILDTLKRGEAVRYGFMGISVGDVELPRSQRVAHSLNSRGARIDAVDPPDGPAVKAGLKNGDVIIAVDSSPVDNRDHLVRMIGFAPVGSTIEVTYLRRGVKRTTTVTLGDRHKILGLHGPE
jgi:serine protease Do